MKHIHRALVISLLISLSGTSALAQEPGDPAEPYADCGICERAESHNWAMSAPGKIVRGLVNAGLGWANLYSQPKKAVSDGDNILLGLGKGLGFTLLRTIQGAVEIGIFWLPPAHDEPLRNCALGDLGATGR